MRIAFHDNSLCIRGTTVALYDYAYYCKMWFGVEPIFLYNKTHIANNEEVINKFKSTFGDVVIGYNNISEIDKILLDNSIDIFFMIKGGKWDGVISNVCKNYINAISVCNINDVHGDKFYMGSKWLSDITNNQIDYVSYMVNLPNIEGNLRKELNIPEEAIVFGRSGGNDSFDISFVKEAIINVIDKRKNIYFLFQNTDFFYNHPRILYLPPNSNLEYKVKFIQTTDVCLHARTIGESGGLNILEFSNKNKQIITYNGSLERNHIDVLGKDGLYYNNYQDIYDIFLNFIPNKKQNFDKTLEFSPKKVMEIFKNKYDI